MLSRICKFIPMYIYIYIYLYLYTLDAAIQRIACTVWKCIYVRYLDTRYLRSIVDLCTVRLSLGRVRIRQSYAIFFIPAILDIPAAR